MSRKICVITGSRAEYGLLRPLMLAIKAEPALTLQLVVTGAHLSADHGATFHEIVNDGFTIDWRVDLQLGADTAVQIASAIALGVSGTAKALAQLQPDLVLVLGDRYEIFAAVAAALVARIPVAHLHGGECTEGAYDEAIRHAITKMSHLHFVAADEYRKRVIQLGEQPQRVFLSGSLGIDNIKTLALLERGELETALDFHLGPKNLLVTFHPVTLEPGASAGQLAELLQALEALPDTHLIFTLPNADNEGARLAAMVQQFVATHPHARCYASLGQLRYLSCVRHVDGVVGNSSSGLIEVPSLHKGTINIGERQQGRLRADSVIDCVPERAAIAAALQQLYSPQFVAKLGTLANPYGDGGATARIVKVLATEPLHGLLKKTFYNIPVPDSGPDNR